MASADRSAVTFVGHRVARRSVGLAIGCGLFATAWLQAAPPAPKLLELPLVDRSLVPIRAVTHGPKFHWFGYYDKAQIDVTGRYLLALEVDAQPDNPKPDDIAKVGMVDLEDGDRWIELGETRAWCWQQGSMLQWRPGSPTEILFNDRDGDHFVCRVLDVKTRKLRTLPMAISAVSPDGKMAVCDDFRRVQHTRPGYGYAGVDDPNLKVLAPEDSGIYRMDLDTGETKFLISIAAIAKIPYAEATARDLHYVNHLQISPDGKRFLMFNRWVSGARGMPTRVFTANTSDGGDVRLLVSKGASHYQWRDPSHVLFWANGGYNLYADDGSGEPKETLWTAPNGHQTYVPGTKDQWLITDTYPQGAKREQILYLFHLPTQRAFILGRFHEPKEYTNSWRCDLHPRITPDGKRVIIDSTHGGDGRQQYLLDISRVIAEGAKE